LRPSPTAKCRPDGENESAVTEDRKEKWYMDILRGTLVKIACPFSSMERRRLPRGVSPMRAMFLR
jgi:hypothetical protein